MMHSTTLKNGEDIIQVK